MNIDQKSEAPATECACRKALEALFEAVSIVPEMQNRKYVQLGLQCRAALATPCPCAEFREQLAEEKAWHEIFQQQPAAPNERAEIAKDAVEALRRIAKIEFPAMSSDGAWVAKTLFCNDMITAFQVREAHAIVARFDAQEGHDPL